MKIAVYGTLRRGGSNNHLMRGSNYLRQSKITGAFYHLGWFPGLCLTGPRDYRARPVVVDIYDVPEGDIPALDRYEGFVPGKPDQSLFNRVTATTVDGEEVNVYVYNYDLSDDYLCNSGDWFDEHQRLEVRSAVHG